MPPPIELAEAVLGSLMGSIGVVAIVLALVRRPRDAAAFWFGVFAAAYGLRLATDSMLVQVLVPVQPVFWKYRDAFITYAILVPAALFAESLGGPGASRCVRWSRRLLAVFAVVVIASDLVTHQPESLIWLNPAAVTLLAVMWTIHLLALARRGGWNYEIRVVISGAMLFGLVALYESYEGGIFGRWELEPFAMLAFIGSLAYVVTRRGLQAERHVIALSRELELAREIQASILPCELPRTPGLRIAARYLPMGEVAGDFYDVISTASGGVGLLVAAAPRARVAPGAVRRPFLLAVPFIIGMHLWLGLAVVTLLWRLVRARGNLRVVADSHPAVEVLQQDGLATVNPDTILANNRCAASRPIPRIHRPRHSRLGR